ncbi:MAG: restriction endonuclease subunit S [Candidatus Paceibacterota bacterium]
MQKNKSLPKNWKREKLVDICEIYQSKTISGKEIKKKGSYVVFGANGKIGYYRKYNHLESQVLVTCRGATCGTVNMSNPKSWITGNAMVIKPKEQGVLKKFLFYILKGLNLSAVITGSAQPQITKGAISSFKILFPPSSEQNKIVKVLDSIQKAVDTQNDLIEKTRELKRVMMKKLFTEGTRGEKQKDPKIGKIPKSWKVFMLKEFVQRKIDSRKPKTGDKYIGLEHLNSGENKIHGFGDGAEVKSTKNIFEVNDILYGKLRPYLDKVALAHFSGVCSTDIMVLQPIKERLTSKFLVYFLHNSSFRAVADATTQGTNHPRTSWERLKKFEFTIPTVNEQKKIVNILQNVDEKIEIHKNKKEKYEELFRSMLHKLITAEVRVDKIKV